jgi:hypothetical protein
MSMMQTLYIILSFVIPLFAIIGFGTLVALLLLKLRNPMTNKIAWKMWDMAMLALFPSRQVILLRKEDGDYAFREAKYDNQNAGYWVENPDKSRHFFQSSGQSAGIFGPVRLLTGYDGFCATFDFIAARISEETYLANVHDKAEPVIDKEGKPVTGVVTVPSRGIVDLRKIKYLAPFNVDPDRFYRIEENAKASLRTMKRQDAVIQGMLIISAVVVTMILTWFIMSQGGGGGGMPSVPVSI